MEVIRVDVRLAVLEAAGRLTPEVAAHRFALCAARKPEQSYPPRVALPQWGCTCEGCQHTIAGNV